jgi:hypothetical protein
VGDVTHCWPHKVTDRYFPKRFADGSIHWVKLCLKCKRQVGNPVTKQKAFGFKGPPAYDKYISSKTWRKRRREVLERSKGKCEKCIANDADEVHHLTYARLGNEASEDLIALCTDCHNEAHFEEAWGDMA